MLFLEWTYKIRVCWHRFCCRACWWSLYIATQVVKYWGCIAGGGASPLLLKHITSEWFSFAKLYDSMTCFSTFSECLTVVDDIVYYLSRVYIPVIERNRVLENIHAVTKVKWNVLRKPYKWCDGAWPETLKNDCVRVCACARVRVCVWARVRVSVPARKRVCACIV